MNSARAVVRQAGEDTKRRKEEKREKEKEEKMLSIHDGGKKYHTWKKMKIAEKGRETNICYSSMKCAPPSLLE